MLQVINKEFENLNELVEYINKVSISYGYLKDYKILNNNDKYNLLLNFDVPEVLEFLELANLVKITSEDRLIYKTEYKIDVKDKREDTYTPYICLNNSRKEFRIQGYFGFKNIYDLVNIHYDILTDHFAVELREFDFENSIIGWHTDIDETLFVREIDYKVLYNHMIKQIFKRGYLIDKISFKEFENDLYYISKWLNREKFK